MMNPATDRWLVVALGFLAVASCTDPSGETRDSWTLQGNGDTEDATTDPTDTDIPDDVECDESNRPSCEATRGCEWGCRFRSAGPFCHRKGVDAGGCPVDTGPVEETCPFVSRDTCTSFDRCVWTCGRCELEHEVSDAGACPDTSDGGGGEPAKTIEWVELLDGPGADEITDVAVDQNGFVYVAGRLTWVKAASFGGGESDAFVARYSHEGTLQWIHLLGGTGADRAVGVDLAPFAGVVVAWNERREAEFTRVHITELSRAGGAEESSVTAEQSGTDVIAEDFVTLDANNMIITGRTDAGAFGEEATGGGPDAFIASFARGETRQWIRFRGKDDGPTLGISVDRSERGAVWLVARNAGENNRGTLELFDVTKKGDVSTLADVVQGRIDRRHTWSFEVGTSAKGPVVTGTFPPSGGAAGDSDALVAAFTPDGTTRFQTTYGGDAIDFAVAFHGCRNGRRG
ncbi:MAG: SBBP repeat-containing protein [Bradymonadaceae bacterium]